jgi:hypothetical protein
MELIGDDQPVLWALACVSLLSALVNELAVGAPLRRLGSAVSTRDIEPVPDLET